MAALVDLEPVAALVDGAAAAVAAKLMVLVVAVDIVVVEHLPGVIMLLVVDHIVQVLTKLVQTQIMLVKVVSILYCYRYRKLLY
jgi:hypothetical protein